jgi:CheY-like chemotaxis protein
MTRAAAEPTRPTVLVVDDDPQFRAAMVRLLADQPYVIEPIHSAAAALARLQASRYELLISDVQMHPMDGYTLIDEVMALGIGLPVVLVSGYDPVEVRARVERIANHPVVEILAKPVYRVELVAAIRRTLATPRVMIAPSTRAS